MIGQTISHYKILAKLGEGGMGVVYKAEDTRLKRIVALKFLPSSIMASEAEKTRFVHEAQAAAALNHPNICTIYEIDEVEGQSFIAMEFVEGETLQKKVNSEQLSVGSAIDIAIQIAVGLAKAHEHGITHRDIKPANVMITKEGVAKILDFGLAKLAGQKTRLTKTGMTLGTVAYMSPEQGRGEEVDQRSDIWAFGVTLYEMLTGQHPFRGEYEAAMVYSILNENPKPPRELRPGLPMELEQIILRALEKNREQRFQSIAEVLPPLKKLCGEGAVAIAKSGDFKTLLAFLKKPRFAIPALALAVLLAVAVFTPYQRLIKLRRAEALLPQIEKLAQNGKYLEAYDLAVQAGRRLANDSTLARLLPDIADHLTVITQPEGARAYLKRFTPAAPSPPREYIGVTPIRDLRMARNDYKLTLEKDGFVPLERIVSSKLERLEILSSKINVEVKLADAASAGENLVFVPGGKYHLVSWAAPTKMEIQLDDFFIDKYEISNAQYRAFIAAGGYLKKQFWKYPFVKDSKALAWEQAMPLFTDRTGLPAPRSWVNQEFPAGKENHPATAISWYEAAAYAEYAGKSLPTIFQWEKAARDGRFSFAFGMVMPWGMLIPGETSAPRANFEGRGSVAVDSFEFGLSPYGCYNMAGNVKEWCRNEITGGYAATGGSWEDPMYLFANYGAFSGFYSSGALGFRCVRNFAGAVSNQGAMKIDLAERTPAFNPVSEATFRSFRSFYQYDKKPLNAKVVETVETADWTREKVLFDGVDDDRMIAYLFLPKRASKPYQCLNFIPHSGVVNGVMHTAAAAENIFAPHLKSGRAVLAVVPKGAKEREWHSGYVRPKIGTVKYRELTWRYVTEFSLGLDYLETRDDIDMSKIACVGVSWGAQGLGLICPVVDGRYRSVIWIGGGVNQSDMQKLPEANPINFVPYLKPPKLLLKGKYDENTPVEIYARPLYKLLREPKKLVLVEAGHFPPLEARVPVINKFLDETLGAVKFE